MTNNTSAAPIGIIYSGGPADGILDAVPSTNVATRLGKGDTAVYYRSSGKPKHDKNGLERLEYIYVGPEAPTDIPVVSAGDHV
ncbi:hypothetical protein ACFV6F_38145 [Kitasatospora phosalacinea]|uniref:hypothetical protein n=1 Tax=Kitasatospora phosalacinea TaxID=2065 RepID=UPI0036694EE6